jgi:hypothetical protein
MGRALLHQWLSFRREPRHCTDASGPDTWFGGRDWLHGCRTSDTTSLHRFLSGASSTFAGSYPGSCWHTSNLLTVRHAVRSARRSRCSDGEFSRLCLIVRRRIPSGALIWRSIQRGISFGSSSFCMWGCGRRFFPFWVLPGLFFLQNGPYVLGDELFPS